MRIGIAGLGRMGSAVAGRLVARGHMVTVWNRTPPHADKLQRMGVTSAPSPEELVTGADAVLSFLRDAAAISDVYRGERGILSAQLDGKIIIEMSTVRPEAQMALARDTAAAGAVFVECAVSGSIGPAQRGELLGLVGATPEALEQARPILDDLCRGITHAGLPGAGASLKLAINLPLLVYYQALGEALSLCSDLKLDPVQLIELFGQSSGGPNMLKNRGPAIAAALKGVEPTEISFDVDTVRKDLGTMLAEATGRGFDLPVTSAALAAFDGASLGGWGTRDCSVLPSWWPRQSAGR